MKIKVGIVDDNKSLGQALKDKIGLFEGFEVNIMAKNGLDILQQLKSASDINLPDVILMDLEMPQMDGIEATALIKQQFPIIKIIILTVFDNDDKIFNAIKAGASGYFLKDESISRIIEGIDEILHGGAPMSSLVALKALELLRNGNSNIQHPADFNLSQREVEILENLSQGMSNKDIAVKCFISPSTVKKHIENIYAKLHISTRAEAVKIALKNNWI
jgi:DNA-binding NarL/FixJ family response regulator